MELPQKANRPAAADLGVLPGGDDPLQLWSNQDKTKQKKKNKRKHKQA